MFDEDIKIAVPSAKKAKVNDGLVLTDEYNRENAKGNIDKAKALGKLLADEVVAHINSFPVEEGETLDETMAIQRGIMMTFAAIVSLEENNQSSVVFQTAKTSFNNRLEEVDPDLYKAVGDTGAFSFYYLAYRRGTEVVRRIGQTFAMLCAHDGDPVYHELGEAIYCWFKSFAEKKFKESGIE